MEGARAWGFRKPSKVRDPFRLDSKRNQALAFLRTLELQEGFAMIQPIIFKLWRGLKGFWTF